MSVVTLEKETLVVMTELADEEIGGVVGGGGYDNYFKAKKVDIDVDNNNDVDIKKVGKNSTVNIIQQNATAIAFNGNATAKNEYSNDRAYVRY
ncbi:MAG: hypothetical protein RMY28_002090 [Nostoc sp. ChiSLP01]|nr:hypothetical protein [Nostoc sp. CmiSLP01]MDZ8284479.1 hypothetical protein [Nostoc sp. ChiSLP01]